MGSQKRKFEDLESQKNNPSLPKSRFYHEFINSKSCSGSHFDISQIHIKSQDEWFNQEEYKHDYNNDYDHDHYEHDHHNYDEDDHHNYDDNDYVEEEEEEEENNSECTRIGCHYEELLQVEYEAAEANVRNLMKLNQQYTVDKMVEEHWSEMKEYMEDAFTELLLIEDDIREGLLTDSAQRRLNQINEEKQVVRKEKDLVEMRVGVVQFIKKRRERDILSVSAHLNRDAQTSRLLRKA